MFISLDRIRTMNSLRKYVSDGKHPVVLIMDLFADDTSIAGSTNSGSGNMVINLLLSQMVDSEFPEEYKTDYLAYVLNHETAHLLGVGHDITDETYMMYEKAGDAALIVHKINIHDIHSHRAYAAACEEGFQNTEVEIY